MSKKIILKYIGDGSALRGVPARDLTENDIMKLTLHNVESLASSSLYKRVEPAPRKKEEIKVSKSMTEKENISND